MKNILISGANGFIGGKLAHYLSDQGFRISGLCYPEIPEDKAWINKFENIICGDIRSDDTIQKISELPLDIMVHLISLDHRESNGKPTYVGSVNIIPTWSLLQVSALKNIKKFIYFSTIHVYGKLKSKIIHEKTVPKPVTSYALTHFLSEKICEYYTNSNGVNSIILRLSNSYGSPLIESTNCWAPVINDLCRMAFYDKKIKLQSDGKPLRDFIHINDVCVAVQKVIENSEKGTFNLSSGRTYTILEIARKIQNIFKLRYGETLPIFLKGEYEIDHTYKIGPIKYYKIDNSKISGIGFDRSTNLHTGINDLFNYLETNAK